jgi:hypothetical protein
MPTTSAELLGLLEEIEESMKSLSAEDQGIVGARLCEMASRFVEAGGTVAATK